MIWLLIFLFLIVLIIIYIDGCRYMSLSYNDIYDLDQEYQCKKRIKNCIITLTTTPNRLEKIKVNLMSLLDQSVAVDEIRLNIPYYSCKGQKYKIPKWLKKLSSIKIYRTVKDWGPATKLIPTLIDKKYDKNQKIIVVDDDVIYGYYTMETLNQYFNKYDKKVAITMYGDYIDKKKRTINDFTTRTKNYMMGERYTDILRGHSAYIVRKGMFKKNVYDYTKVPKECFFVDDNYFSFHLKKNKVPILMVGMCYKGVPLPDMINCCIDGLHPTVNHDGHNERVVNRYFS